MSTSTQNALTSLAGSLLAQAGLRVAVRSINPMTGGRNNKVFALTLSDERVFLLKLYYHAPHDSRDRLGQEIAFLKHLAESGCTCVPAVIAAEPTSHAALLEFIQGSRLQLEDVTDNLIQQAIEFFRQTNQSRETLSARKLPPASEACFSLADHVQTTQRRVDRLDNLLVEEAVDKEAVRFVHEQLRPHWKRVREQIEAKRQSPELTLSLPTSDRRLSPSDFGFHNALREPSGRIRFLDFEYAGWDDPAKLVCDFANQPDMLLDRRLSDLFKEAVIVDSAEPQALRQRIAMLEPLYQVKWVCICLNDFLATGRDRHRFTDGEKSDHLARRKSQLDRARTMLERAGQAISSLCH